MSNEKVMSYAKQKFPFKHIQPRSNIRASEQVLRSMLRLSYFDIFTIRKILTAQMAVLFVVAACYALSSCGGGSSSGSSPSGSQP